MMRVNSLIDQLGGNAAVARSLGLNPSTVSEMKRRGSIHPRYWPKLIDLATSRKLKGVDAAALMAAHAGARDEEAIAS